jgi:hypothetical protein
MKFAHPESNGLGADTVAPSADSVPAEGVADEVKLKLPWLLVPVAFSSFW